MLQILDLWETNPQILRVCLCFKQGCIQFFWVMSTIVVMFIMTYSIIQKFRVDYSWYATALSKVFFRRGIWTEEEGSVFYTISIFRRNPFFSNTNFNLEESPPWTPICENISFPPHFSTASLQIQLKFFFFLSFNLKNLYSLIFLN